ncbi:MAG: hypothetical protein LUQ31_00205, partial [Methanoregula sp.]|nr:hypothetical protein [Methanoregula sp.]
VEEGLVEADILIRNYADGKKAAERQEDETGAGPLAAIRSLFSSRKEGAESALSEQETGLVR